MTLVLTELSNAGIAMVADSAISEINLATGRVNKVNKDSWRKLLRVPSIGAAISYWGVVGALTRKQFDLWLKERVIESKNYSDIDSFVDHFVATLNDATSNRPLANYQNIGVHVAGYSNWDDGERRPVLFHVNNGDLEFDLEQYDYKKYPIRLFEKNQNFPSKNATLEQNIRQLEVGVLLRNGHYSDYMVIWNALEVALKYIETHSTLSIPSNPNDLQSRKEYLKMAIEIVIRIYDCSNQKNQSVIGGEVVSLGIGANGYLLPIDERIG